MKNRQLPVYAATLAFILLSFFPFVWTLLSSFKPPLQLFQNFLCSGSPVQMDQFQLDFFLAISRNREVLGDDVVVHPVVAAGGDHVSQ